MLHENARGILFGKFLKSLFGNVVHCKFTFVLGITALVIAQDGIRGDGRGDEFQILFLNHGSLCVSVG